MKGGKTIEKLADITQVKSGVKQIIHMYIVLAYMTQMFIQSYRWALISIQNNALTT